MPMREDCRYFQSRTYASGESARFCVLDLAPEAPWRCPDDCPRYSRRLVDVGWTVGSARRPPTPDEPEMIELNDHAAALLDEAEDLLNTVGSEIIAEYRREAAKRAQAESSIFGKLRRRFRRRG